MIRGIIFSDAHRNYDRVACLVDYYKYVDFIYSLGDLELSFIDVDSMNIVCVRGNSYSDKEDPYDRIFNLGPFNLLLTHGHTHGVREGMLRMSLLCKENHIDIAFYGHTHISSIYNNDGIYFINPGSLSLPYNTSYGTYIYFEVEGNEFRIFIKDIDTHNVVSKEIIKK